MPRSVTVRLPFWPTVLTQGASSFINRVSPANVGGMALNVRYLQKTGVEPSAGVAAVGVNALAGAIVHVDPAGDLPRLGRPRPGPGVQAAVEQQAAADPGRSWPPSSASSWSRARAGSFAVRKLLPSLRSSLASLWRVARSPVRLALLFGGSALVTLAYIGGLAASVAAFGASASIAQVGAVYLVASFIAAASPTPGGLGAIEAATIAGLTGIGISSGPAVSAVLVYRLATYWLPVLPGWYSWRLLQRMDYL